MEQREYCGGGRYQRASCRASDELLALSQQTYTRGLSKISPSISRCLAISMTSGLSFFALKHNVQRLALGLLRPRCVLQARYLLRYGQTNELIKRQSFSLRDLYGLPTRGKRKAEWKTQGAAILFVQCRATSQETDLQQYTADSTGNVTCDPNDQRDGIL